MNYALPKLRTDLAIRPQVTKGGTFFIVKDPVSGQFFRFGEAEEFILRQFDGETPLDVIRMRAQEQFGEALAPEVLNAFVKELQTSGILETGGADVRRNPGHGRRIRGNWLYLRFKLFDPTWIFDRLSGWIGFFFTPFFLAVSAAVILFAVDTAIVNAGELIGGFRSLAQASAIPLYLTVAFLTIGLHEFAHGLTCRHFGGEVHEIGFLLMYFQPALYCNVSDAWLFPEKSKRLWVSFAGPYFELFVWAIAMLTWRSSEPGTAINVCALAVAGISGLKTLLNFNPLIKLDGYYLLSDFLEIPNLRRKSFRSIGALIRRIMGQPGQPDGDSRRERTIYTAYGLIAAAGSFVLMGSLIVTAFKYLGDGDRPAILAVPVTAALVIRGRRWSQRLFAGTSKSSGIMDDDLDLGESPSAAISPLEQESQAVAVRNQLATTIKKGHSRSRWPRRLGYTVLVAIAITGVSQLHAPMRIAGGFSVLPGESADVRVSVDGIIDRLYVNEGDRVQAGDLIALLSDRDVRNSLDKADAEIREARAKLRMLQAGPTKAEIAVTDAGVATAAGQVKYAQRKLAREKLLLDAGLIARSAFDEMDEQATAMEGGLLEAKARREAVVNSIRPEQIDEVVAQIDGLETGRRLIQQQLRSLQVVSPVAGIVGTPSRQLLQMLQQFVKKGDPIAKIYDFRIVKAQIMISEKEISAIRVGQPIELKARAYPEATFRGKVTFIATSANAPGVSGPANAAEMTTVPIGKSVNAVVVNSEIDNRSSLLKPEMTGQARIDCGRKRVADLFLWHVTRYLKADSLPW